jgi:hypothetical protein
MPIRVSATPASCPDCGRKIAWQHVRFGQSFGCPSCRMQLRVRGAYMQTLNLTGWAIAFLLAYAIGLRNWSLLVVGLVGVIPIQTVVMLITLRLFSVEFEGTGEFKDILYSTDSEDTDATPVATNMPERPPIAVRLWELFKGVNQPRSLEGYALQFGIVAMAMFLVWMPAVRLLRSVRPEFDATRAGPKGFAVTVHIGESMLGFTNGSDVSWTCRAELGMERLPGAFEVDARKTTQISFARFDPSGTLDQSRMRGAAQDRIYLVCEEPSGISHSALLR